MVNTEVLAEYRYLCDEIDELMGKFDEVNTRLEALEYDQLDYDEQYEYELMAELDDIKDEMYEVESILNRLENELGIF